MRNAIIIHGSVGHPQENWFPWLKTELEGLGYVVHVPAFPTPEGQSYEAWLDILKEYPLDGETILIGHSTGPIFILNALNDLDVKIKAAFLVVPFEDALGNDYFDGLNSTFLAHKRDWQTIKQNCEKFHLYYSDNDPYVPVDASIKIADALGVKAIEVKGAGHFNEEAGYVQFPQLLDDIKKIANQL